MEKRQFRPDISIVVPVYDESGNIEPLVEEVHRTLRGRLRYELIFVDGGSKDATFQEMLSAAEQNRGVVALRHAGNRGQSAAGSTGVAAAGAAIVAVLDGDGQNDPQDIPKFFGHLVAVTRLKMVIGERRNRQDRWICRVSSRVANGIRAKLLGDGISDTDCGNKVFYRDDFLSLPAFDHKGIFESVDHCLRRHEALERSRAPNRRFPSRPSEASRSSTGSNACRHPITRGGRDDFEPANAHRADPPVGRMHHEVPPGKPFVYVGRDYRRRFAAGARHGLPPSSIAR